MNESPENEDNVITSNEELNTSIPEKQIEPSLEEDESKEDRIPVRNANYEFDSTEERIISHVGIIGLIIGGLFILTGLIDTIFMFIGSEFTLARLITNFIYLVLCVAFFLPFQDLWQIQRTKGNDIDLLMKGFTRMTLGFKLIVAGFGVLLIINVIELFGGN
ncbi:MAG: hypothetical protein INQ03_22760 [Candidatus Heimdallarchaeota archaeon]|nr:hypothetical protein [Candidatus Heimdallarchaeota archaeon]